MTGSATMAGIQFLFIILVPLLFGYSVTYRLKGPYFLGERLLFGLALGTVTLTLLCFLLSLLFGFQVASVYAALVLIAAFAVWKILRVEGKRVDGEGWYLAPEGKRKKISRVDRYGAFVFLASLAFFWVFGSLTILWKNGALNTGIIDNYGDLPFHLGAITGFLNGGSLPPQNHTFAGHQLTYPFLSDFFSSMLILLGIPLEYSIELPCILLNSVAMTLLFYVGYRMVRHTGAASMAPVLFVLAGGLGFLWFLSDLYLANKPVWEILTHLPRRYTSLGEEGIFWINPTLAHLIPQRSLLFGFPLAISLAIFWLAEKDKDGGNAWIPGLFAGLLPLSHTHTFLSMMIVGGIMALMAAARREGREKAIRFWGLFFATTTILALPQVLYIVLSRVAIGGFIRFDMGWMSGEENLFWFWLKNTGAIIPLLLAALLFRKAIGIRRSAILFYIPFGLLLIIGNLFLFAPLEYDTNKILVYGFLLAMPLIAMAMVSLFRAKSWWVHGPLFRVLLLVLVLSGGLNLIHELQGGGWEEMTVEEIKLARIVGSETESGTIFLTAPIHNSFLTLAGRGVVLGYPGHVLSHGLDHEPIEEGVKEIFSGGDKAIQKLHEYQVDYIVVGPHERSKYGDSVDWFKGLFPEYLRTENYVIYRNG